jgi:hypothetical protein
MEEILIPERECEYPPLCDIRQQTMDDDEYTPTQKGKKSIQPTITSERKKTTTTTTDILPISSTSGEYLFVFIWLQRIVFVILSFDKEDDDDDDFDCILPNHS